MKIEYYGIREPMTYYYDCNDYELKIYGDYWREIPKEFDVKKDFSFLNFDGGYVAFFLDKVTNKTIVYHGSADTMDVFFLQYEDRLIFSDCIDTLIPYCKNLTWNLNAINDYFEPSWNNIIKKNRSPFIEISRLENGNYLLVQDNDYVIHKWNLKQRQFKFTVKNLSDFRERFFEILDFYIERIGKKCDDEIAVSISGGLDTNTIAARMSKKLPKSSKWYYTTKVDDITDESKLALEMERVLDGPINYINLSNNTDGHIELISMIKNYLEYSLSPRFINELYDDVIADELVKNNKKYAVSGMGADGVFGYFSGEYYYLIKEYIFRHKYFAAFNIFKSAKYCFEDCKPSVLSFIKLVIREYAGILPQKRNNVNKYLLVNLPECDSSKVNNYEEALEYASYDGASRSMSLSWRKHGINVFMPFEGYLFQELSMQCDPYIFCNKYNKSCLRFAVRDLLPINIQNQIKKRGNPAPLLRTIFNMGNNRLSIKNYLCTKTSHLINVKELLSSVCRNIFGQNEFLSLSLLLYEDYIKEKYGKEITVPK